MAITDTSYGLLDTSTGQIKGAGHTNGVAPTVVPAAGAGVGATSVFGTTQVATDSLGQIVLTTAGTPAAGDQCTVTFGAPYSVPPIVLLTPGDAATAAIMVASKIYAKVKSDGTGWTVAVTTTALGVAAYTFNYHVPASQV